jgi:hypothetical protein
MSAYDTPPHTHTPELSTSIVCLCSWRPLALVWMLSRWLSANQHCCWWTTAAPCQIGVSWTQRSWSNRYRSAAHTAHHQPGPTLPYPVSQHLGCVIRCGALQPLMILLREQAVLLGALGCVTSGYLPAERAASNVVFAKGATAHTLCRPGSVVWPVTQTLSGDSGLTSCVRTTGSMETQAWGTETVTTQI